MSRRREMLMKWTIFALVCALWTGVIVACGNSQQDQDHDTPPAGNDTPEPAKEPPPPPPEPAKEPPPPPPPEPVANDGGAAPAADAGAAPAACGRPGQPMCPLQAYMKQTMLPAMRSGQGIEESFTRVAPWAPDPAYNEGPNGWRTTAEAGAAAIKAGNKAGAQAACKACHSAWQKRYRTEFRNRPVPTP